MTLKTKRDFHEPKYFLDKPASPYCARHPHDIYDMNLIRLYDGDEVLITIATA
jgi:hypothetical protein